ARRSAGGQGAAARFRSEPDRARSGPWARWKVAHRIRAGRAPGQFEDPARFGMIAQGIRDRMPMGPFLSPPSRSPEALRAAGESRSKPGVGLAGRRILIVEDEAMISALIEMIVGEAGCAIVGPVATLERALEIIERERFDVALLDVRVNDRDVYPLADV